MSLWVDRILGEFPADLARLWVVTDPDSVLLDERILFVLRERGFEVLPFEDSIVFRAEYEERYREAWDRGETGPAKALILHLQSSRIDELPWDYCSQARVVRLSLADLFHHLSYNVVRQLDPEHREALFTAQNQYATQSLGDGTSKDFVLTHIFNTSPHLISGCEDLWRELLRLHYRDTTLPPLLVAHVADILCKKRLFDGIPVQDLFSSKLVFLRVLQTAWNGYLGRLGVAGPPKVRHIPSDNDLARFEIPFDYPDVRAIVSSMFLNGSLRPLAVQAINADVPEWARVGMLQDPAELRNIVFDGINRLLDSTPNLESSHRDWTQYARRLGDILFRYYTLDSTQASLVRDKVREVQMVSDKALNTWITKHYADLPSLPVTKSPVMVHHVPRFLGMRREAGESKIALLVFDGLALEQWAQLRDYVAAKMPEISFEESACFAWLPTITSVSRQALLSGLKPREFSDSIDTNVQEPSQWSRVWQDNGLRSVEIFYRKKIRYLDQLDEVDTALDNGSIKAAAIVVDTVDQIVHGAVLGKRGIASQILDWCETGFVERLFRLLMQKGFQIYLTSDHGNVEAVGIGRPNQGVIAETRGERVRAYRSETLCAESAKAFPETTRLEIGGLPTNFIPLFASERGAFVQKDLHLVAHGGISVEELIVPFVKVSYSS